MAVALTAQSGLAAVLEMTTAGAATSAARVATNV
jgi:hypothetical protein